MSEAVPLPPEVLDVGYCVRCGQYGRGRFRELINWWSASIDQHQGCQMPPRGKTAGRSARPIRRLGRS